MVKVNVSSAIQPNKKTDFLRDLNIAFVKGNIQEIGAYLANDIIWHLVGDKTLKGKKDFLQLMEDMKEHVATEMTIDNIITQGRESAVHGSLLMESGSRYRFADFYTFNSPGGKTIRSLTSYVIELKEH